MRTVMLCMLWLCACSFQARNATVGGDGSAVNDGSTKLDGNPTFDAPAGDGTQPDAPAGTCAVAGLRVCVDSTHAGYCNSALQPVIDRACPPTSTCAGGHCLPPPAAGMCSKASDCSSGVCDLYVVGSMLDGYCTPVEGAGGVYANCSPTGNNSSCKTGLCALDGEDAAHQQCLVPCRAGMDSDCPTGGSCHSIGQPTTIEGTPVTGSACFL